MRLETSKNISYHSLHVCGSQIPASLREERDVVTQQSAGRQVSEDGQVAGLFRSINLLLKTASLCIRTCDIARSSL